MRNAEKLKNSMRIGGVYRRKDLEDFSTALDRDLKTLVARKEVLKVAGGLYYRPRKNSFGFKPPNDRDLVRTFLKTNDFLLTSYNYFNQLGLGLTQVYNNYVVYNHKRSGNFSLGGKRFKFRVVPAYPPRMSKEFLLVDLLNNLKDLPDNTELVLRNLNARLSEFDQKRVLKYVHRYGRHSARAVVQKAYDYVRPRVT
jgi:hypothetical protein